jgi:hypothetical protein
MRIAAIALYLRRFLLAWLVSLPLAAAPAAASGVDPALLAPLAGDDTDARLQAIAALGQLPEPEAAAVLQALGVASETLFEVDGLPEPALDYRLVAAGEAERNAA